MAEVLCMRQRELTHVLSDLVDEPGVEPEVARSAMLVMWRTPLA